MNVQVQTILFYQITIALWIAFVLGGLYALVHRDAFLKYWSFSWLAVAASLAGALLISVTGPGDGMMPTLALVAGNDEVVAATHARALVAAFRPGGITVIEVPGAGHNDIQLWPPYDATIGGFFNSGT